MGLENGACGDSCRRLFFSGRLLAMGLENGFGDSRATAQRKVLG